MLACLSFVLLLLGFCTLLAALALHLFSTAQHQDGFSETSALPYGKTPENIARNDDNLAIRSSASRNWSRVCLMSGLALVSAGYLSPVVLPLNTTGWTWLDTRVSGEKDFIPASDLVATLFPEAVAPNVSLHSRYAEDRLSELSKRTGPETYADATKLGKTYYQLTLIAKENMLANAARKEKAGQYRGQQSYKYTDLLTEWTNKSPIETVSLSERYEGFLDSLGPRKALGKFNLVGLTQDRKFGAGQPATESHFEGYFNAYDGVIIQTNSLISPNKNGKLPKIMQVSDILATVYNYMAGRGHQEPSKLKHLLMTQPFISEDDVVKITESLLKQRGVKEEGQYDQHLHTLMAPKWPGLKFEPETDDFYATLGTSLGLDVLLLTLENRASLGYKKIKSVTLFRDDVSTAEKYLGPSLLFELEDGESSGKAIGTRSPTGSDHELHSRTEQQQQSEHPENDISYDQAEKDGSLYYELSLIKDIKQLNKVSKAKHATKYWGQAKYTMKDLNKIWTESQTSDAALEKVTGMLQAPIKALGLKEKFQFKQLKQDKGFKTSGLQLKKEPATHAELDAAFDVTDRAGTIIRATWNPYLNKPSKAPKMMDPATILPIQYNNLSSSLKMHPNKLKYILMSRCLLNPERATVVAHDLLKKHGTTETGVYKKNKVLMAPKWPGIKYDATKPGFNATLGTTAGLQALLIALENQATFGPKTVKEVTLFSDELSDAKDYEGPSYLFELMDVS